MNTQEKGSTILGILLGMLGGIALTSGLAWFIFKTPATFVPQNQVVARDLQLPTGVVEELIARQNRTGAADVSMMAGGYRVRTNRNHEIFVTPIAQSGVPPQPEMQVKVKHTATSGGAGKPHFEFYEILSQRHYATPQQPELIVENHGAAKISIYAPEKAVPPLVPPPARPIVQPVAPKPVPKVTAQPVAHASAIPNTKPFVSPRNTPVAASPAPVTTPVKPVPHPIAPSPQTNAATPANSNPYLEVDFFPSYADAAKLQEKLLMKGFSVQLKEKKYLGKRAGYSVFTGPFPDAKSESDARTKLKKMGLNPAN